MFALAPSPLPPEHTIIHKYSVQCAPYNETGLLIFPMLATSLGARFGGCELFAVCSHRYRYIRRQCDGNGNGNGNSSDDTYRHIAVAVIAVSHLPARRPCAHFVCSPTTPALLLLLLLLRFCRRSLPILFVCSLVRLLLRTSTCFRCEPLPLPLPLSLPLALALAVLGQRLWAQQSEILVRMYRQAGRQRPYKRISRNWSNSIVRYVGSLRPEVVVWENIKEPKGLLQIRYAT